MGNRSTWTERHTIKVAQSGCWTWNGDLQDGQLAREEAYKLYGEGRLGNMTVTPLATCREGCINPAHMQREFKDRHKNGKLSVEEVLAISEATGTFTSIAANANVTVQTVSNIKHGQTYGDVTGIERVTPIRRRRPKSD